MSGEHKPGCEWQPEGEHCTCGLLVPAKAYRFANGNVIVFDQFGNQMPYYQDRTWGAVRLQLDFPDVRIRPGEVA